jgi:hypothetical protein
MMETLLVPYDFDGNRFTGTVISTLKDLTEGAFAKSVDNLVAISKVITVDYLVITPIIIVTIVISRVIASCKFFITASPNVVNSRIIENLFSFIVGKIDCLTTLQYG